MTDTILEQEEGQDVAGAIEEKLSGVDPEVKAEDSSTVPESDVCEEVVLPEIRGLEILKEGTYAVNLDKRISDMLGVIKSMEGQLESVLSQNAYLKKDLDASKEMIFQLSAEKSRLESVISRMEEEIPSKRELQIEIDHLIEERNMAQGSILKMKSDLEKMKKESTHDRERIVSLEEDKKDAIVELDYFESKLSSANKKAKEYEKDLNRLRGERFAHKEKIESLEADLKALLKENYALFEKLNEAERQP